MRNYKLKTCKRCGKEFKPTGSNQIYCEECRIIAHKEKKRGYNKQYRITHKEEIKQQKKQYRALHKKEIKEYDKQYNTSHKEEKKEYSREYRNLRKEKIKEYKKQYRILHREEIKKQNKRYPQTSAGKKAMKKSKAHRRQLDFNPLNEYFEGSEAHHINTKDVVYIPKELHRSIWHNVWTGENMNIINAQAVQFLLGNYVIYG